MINRNTRSQMQILLNQRNTIMSTKISTSCFAEMNFFHFYRIDELVCADLRRLLAQVIETYLDVSEAVVLLQLSEEDLFSLARAYRDILVGYEHPRKSSAYKRYDHTDKTLLRIYERFPRMSRDLLRHNV